MKVEGSMRKKYVYMLVGVIVVVAGGYFVVGNNGSQEARYRTEKISRGDVVVQVRATGTINPVRTVEVGSQVSGTISKIFVDFNSTVKAGQVVAIIDSTFLYASVKEAEANLERAQAQVNDTKRTFNRTKELFSKDLVAQADLDAAQTNYEQAVAQLKQTRAALDRAIVNLRFSVIRAPIDGVVISRDVDVGQTVAASLQAPKLFSIANDLKNMQVEASVDEADIGQIREGQAVTFTVDAYPDDQFEGRVAQVRLAPITVQNVVTYTIIIEVPNPDMKLRPGMTATVSILIDKRENVLRLPTLALRFQPPADVAEKFQKSPGDTSQQSRRPRMMRREDAQGGSWEQKGEQRKKMRVWVLQGKNLKPVQVELGLTDNRYVEATGGSLAEGDEVVLGLMVPDGGQAMQGPTNPFQQRMPGGGGGSGRR